jgi:type IV secretion system protein VirD4
MATAGLTLSQVFAAVALFFSRIRAFFRQTHSLHTARFAYLYELTGLLTPTLDESMTTGQPSLLLGTSYFHHLLTVRPTKTRKELGNLLLVAPTRGGKGLAAVSQLLTWPHAVIVNDIKGELFTQTAGYRATLGNVYVIDPTGVGHCYDPLLGKHTEDALLSAATHLLYQPDEGEGKIFTQRAIIMLTQLFLAARAESAPPLPYVRAMIRRGLPDVAARLNAIDPDLATQFLDVPFTQATFTDRFLLSAWGTLSARLRPLLTETVIRSLAGSDVLPRDVMGSQQPLTIYLRWKEQDLLALSPLVRLSYPLMWSSIIDELITTYDQQAGEGCQPVLLLIDEAGRTAIPSLADHTTTVVGRGISLWIAVQSLSQLDVVYGKERATILRDNIESQLYYRPNDQDTADYLEHCLGRKSDYAKSQTLRDGTETSEGRSEQGVSLLTAWEIKQLRDEEIIAFHRLLPPFLAKRMDWRNYPLLRKRRMLPAPVVPSLPPLSELPFSTSSDSTHELIDPDSPH